MEDSFSTEGRGGWRRSSGGDVSEGSFAHSPSARLLLCHRVAKRSMAPGLETSGLVHPRIHAAWGSFLHPGACNICCDGLLLFLLDQALQAPKAGIITGPVL